MNKKVIITMMLALVAMACTSNALDFCIDHEDVAIAVNKDITGNDIPDEVQRVCLLIFLYYMESNRLDFII